MNMRGDLSYPVYLVHISGIGAIATPMAEFFGGDRGSSVTYFLTRHIRARHRRVAQARSNVLSSFARRCDNHTERTKS